MGLSDGERDRGAMNGVHGLVETARKLMEEVEKDGPTWGLGWEQDNVIFRIVKIANKLWPAAVGGDGNSAYWITGSDTNDIHPDGNSPWHAAMHDHLPQWYTSGHEEVLTGKREPGSLLERLNENSPFNAIDYLGVRDLLKHFDPKAVMIVEMYWRVESLMYYIARYRDDKLHDRWRSVAHIAAEITGECYGIFRSTDAFARCAIAGKIFEKHMYLGRYPYGEEKEWDEVTAWLSSNNIHHYMARVAQDPERHPGGGMGVLELSKILAQLEEAKSFRKGHPKSRPDYDDRYEYPTSSYQAARVVAAVTMSGRRFSDKHMIVKLTESMSPSVLRFGDSIRVAFEGCVAAKKEYDKQAGPSDHDDDPTGLCLGKIDGLPPLAVVNKHKKPSKKKDKKNGKK